VIITELIEKTDNPRRAVSLAKNHSVADDRQRKFDVNGVRGRLGDRVG
jgi:hypothetical protein